MTMSAAWATALLAYLRGFGRMQLGAVCALVAGAGWLLGAHALARAIHPPLRTLLAERGDEDPVLVEGRLREDAAITGTGVVLRIDVRQVTIDGVLMPI